MTFEQIYVLAGMISSGGLSQIPDPELRRALSRYAENASDYERLYGGALDKLTESAGRPTLMHHFIDRNVVLRQMRAR